MASDVKTIYHKVSSLCVIEELQGILFHVVVADFHHILTYNNYISLSSCAHMHHAYYLQPNLIIIKD